MTTTVTIIVRRPVGEASGQPWEVRDNLNVFEPQYSKSEPAAQNDLEYMCDWFRAQMGIEPEIKFDLMCKS